MDERTVNRKPAIALSLLVALTIFGFTHGELVEHEVASFVRWSKTQGPWAVVLMFALSTLMPVIMLPVFPLMALTGPLFTAMYGSWLIGGTVAYVAVFSGLWLGSVIAFALGKTIFKSFAERASKSTTLSSINRLVDRRGVKIVLMARASPLMPAEVFDYACAVTTLKTWQYAVGCSGSAIPVAFWTFSSAQAAAAARNGHPSREKMIGLIVINVITLAGLTALLVRMIGREDAAAVAGHNPVVKTIERASSSFLLNFRPFSASAREVAAGASQSPLMKAFQRSSPSLPPSFRLQASVDDVESQQEHALHLPARSLSSPVSAGASSALA